MFCYRDYTIRILQTNTFTLVKMYKSLNNQSQGADNCAEQEITYGQIDNQYVVDLKNKTDPDRLAQINGFFLFSYRDYTKDSLG